MSQPPHDDDNPVRNGIVALLGVSLAVGLILGIVALMATHFLGLAGGNGSSTGAGGAGASMYLPPPEKTTEGNDGPLITLYTPPTKASADATTEAAPPSASASPSVSAKPKRGDISLQALETTVPNFGKIDLTGVYPGGEGQILQVQRQQDGQWTDFAATVPVSNATFSTYIQTGVSGKNVFRVFDKTRNIASNPVAVTVR